MAELQLIDHSVHVVRPYIEIGSGYVIEKQGIIHGNMEYFGSFEYSKDLAVFTLIILYIILVLAV